MIANDRAYGRRPHSDDPSVCEVCTVAPHRNAESTITFPSTDVSNGGQDLLRVLWDSEKSLDWEVFPYRCVIVNDKFVLLLSALSETAARNIGYVGTYLSRGKAIYGMLEVQSICYNPNVTARLILINDLDETIERLKSPDRLGNGPCYCAVNENHPGVCQGADCTCHGEPGPRTEDDEPAEDDDEDDE